MIILEVPNEIINVINKCLKIENNCNKCHEINNNNIQFGGNNSVINNLINYYENKYIKYFKYIYF